MLATPAVASASTAMANLPDCWHEASGPVREDIDIFVGSLCGARWDVFQLQDDAAVAVPLTGMAITAELRTLDDQLLSLLTAEFTDAAAGWCRVSASADLAAALPGTTWRNGVDPRVKIGRYAVFITDVSGRWCIKAGDAYGIRK